MTDLQQMSRVLYHHCWTNVDDWARTVDQLADLTDAEIGQLQYERCEAAACSCAVPATSASPSTRPSLMERTRQGFSGLCGLLFGLRRTC